MSSAEFKGSQHVSYQGDMTFNTDDPIMQRRLEEVAVWKKLKAQRCAARKAAGEEADDSQDPDHKVWESDSEDEFVDAQQ